jgi:hypothetical protein
VALLRGRWNCILDEVLASSYGEARRMAMELAARERSVHPMYGRPKVKIWSAEPMIDGIDVKVMLVRWRQRSRSRKRFPCARPPPAKDCRGCISSPHDTPQHFLLSRISAITSHNCHAEARNVTPGRERAWFWHDMMGWEHANEFVLLSLQYLSHATTYLALESLVYTDEL